MDPIQTPEVSLWVLLQQGGIVIYFLLLCSVVALAFGIERLWTILRQPNSEEPLLTQIRTVLEQGNINEAQRVCEEKPGAIATVALAGLYKRGASRQELRETMESVGGDQIALLERHMILLRTMAEITPLLGFLGTVTGMIQAFYAIAQAGLGDPSIVGGGIAKALVTTATGLFIAIPTLVLHNYLVGRTDVIVAAMDRLIVHLSEIMAPPQE